MPLITTETTTAALPVTVHSHKSATLECAQPKVDHLVNNNNENAAALVSPQQCDQRQ